ncbi:MAG TPA: hypothetical protein VGA18_09035 [Rhodothermales bacterium]
MVTWLHRRRENDHAFDPEVFDPSEVEFSDADEKSEVVFGKGYEPGGVTPDWLSCFSSPTPDTFHVQRNDVSDV